MREKHQQQQEGQTLVHVAMLMVVLLAFAALAIDGGRIYLERRFLQNAADAGALAGARAMCFDNMTYDEAKTPAEAMARPNVPYPDQAEVSFPAAGEGIMKVTVQESALPTFMASIVGLDTVKVGATAAAACGPTNTVCGLFPIAFSETQWDPMCDDCGKPFYVWTGDYDPGDPTTGPDCSVCNCDLDPSWPGDEIFSTESRAWLDFTGVVGGLYPVPGDCTKGGCGASELKCWVANLNPAPVKIPSCIGGDTGIKAGVRKEIEDRAGHIVKIPIFDGYCSAPNCKEGFHVIKFGCVQVDPVEPWVQKLELDFKNGAKKCWWGKVIAVSVSCDEECYTACGTTEGGGCPTGSSSVCAVNLIE